MGSEAEGAGGGLKPTQPPVDGPITKALMEAVAMRRQMLDAGHIPEYVDHEVGKGLKALLGNKRPEPWRFLCDRCRDTGWSEVRPSPETEAKLLALYGNTTDHQGYSVKCDPCRYMEREREKRRKQHGQEFDPDDDLAGAGQTKPTRGFKRFGR